MKPNVGTADRVVRALAGLGMLVACAVAPLPLLARVAVLGATDVQADRGALGWLLAVVRAVPAAIAALDRPLREVIVLRDLEGLSGDETCAALGETRATMKARLHRARAPGCAPRCSSTRPGTRSALR